MSLSCCIARHRTESARGVLVSTKPVEWTVPRLPTTCGEANTWFRLNILKPPPEKSLDVYHPPPNRCNTAICSSAKYDFAILTRRLIKMHIALRTTAAIVR